MTMPEWRRASVLGVIATAMLAVVAHAGYRLVPVEGAWMPRTRGTATRLPDGRVLIAGGNRGPASGPTAATEIFDPDTRRLSPGPSLIVPRTQHAALALPDGRVLLVGGTTLTYIVPTASAEIIHAETGSQRIADMALPRGGEPFLALARDGSAFVFGGTQEGRFGQINELVEQLIPGATAWTPAGRLELPCQAAWLRLDAERVLRLPGGEDRSSGHVLRRACASWAEEWRLAPSPAGRLVGGLASPHGQALGGTWAEPLVLVITTETAILELDPSGVRSPRVLRTPSNGPHHDGPPLLAWGQGELVVFGPAIRILHLESGGADDVLEWTWRKNFTATVVSPEMILIAGGTNAEAPTGLGTIQPPMLLIRDPPPSH